MKLTLAVLSIMFPLICAPSYASADTVRFLRQQQILRNHQQVLQQVLRNKQHNPVLSNKAEQHNSPPKAGITTSNLAVGVSISVTNK
ncbi:MAG: hypothetical protein EON60_06745 [Alphaproteobacteria bacterium]|nr:MAG: hypothetical protein EON60_06745 [Alphaproteobacteria bacterium]